MRLPADLEERAAAAWTALPDGIRELVPASDAWALDPDVRAAALSAESARRVALCRLLGDGTDPDGGRKLREEEILAKRKVFLEACAADPVFFIENCVWTQDPEGKAGFGRPMVPLRVFGYAKDLWLRPWLECLDARGGRLLHDKSRRMLMSIYRMAYEVWSFRFVPGMKSWVSTDKEQKLDNWYDFDSLLGKFRVMWDFASKCFPWMFPELPPHSDVNKMRYLRFPEWKAGRRACFPECWGNELKGILPADPRGGAARKGFCDEAAYTEDLGKLLDAAESMTPDLVMGSSAPPDVSNVYWKRRELEGVRANTAPWYLNPLNLRGIRWSEPGGKDAYPGEYRGPHTRRWRSDVYNAEARRITSQELARNWDIDPRASAGSKVFLNWDSLRACGQKDPADPTWDLYRPDLELQVWYDPGRGDPWALVWVQLDYDNGCVNVVDYDMGADKTVHYFVPMLLGWPWETKARWRTSPEALPWHEVVPWSYDEARIERIRRWNLRRGDRGGRVKMMWGDFAGTQHYGNDLYSIHERLQHYGLYSESVPSNYKRESFIEKADEILLRTRISGRLVGVRPEGRWPSVDEAFQYWRRRERSETTRAGTPAEPLHDDYSHPAMAFVYGASQLPMLMKGRVTDREGRVEPVPGRVQERMVIPDRGWW